jgi:hypothetical protein
VRPSTWFYPRFSLPMVRSLAFTVPPPNGLGLLCKLTRWIVLQKARRHRTSRLRLLVRTQFQVLFHSATRGSFYLSLTVLVHYRSQDIFSLGGWSLRFQSGFHVSRPTRQRWQDKSLQLVIIRFPTLRVPGFHSLWRSFPEPSARLGNFLPYAGWW